MKQDELLTPEVIVFLMMALLGGRLSREDACRLVTAWVEGTSSSTQLAEDGAQLIHGFDVVLGSDGREHHASSIGSSLEFRLHDDEMKARCQGWLARVGRA